MSDQGTVSTKETPRDDEPMNVVTEEKLEGQPSPQADAAPPKDGAPDPGKSATPDPKDQSNDGDQPPKKKRGRGDRRIARLQRELREERAKGAQRDQENQRLSQEVESLKQAQASPPLEKPKLQDFKDAEEFGKAWAKWEAQQKQPDAAPPPPATPPPAATPPATPQVDPEVAAFEEKGVELYGEDFAETLHDPSLPLSPNMADYLFDSDKGTELLLFLDENREDAKDLFHLRPRALAKKFAEIEAELESPPPPADNPPPDSERPRDDKGRYISRSPEPPPPPPGAPERGAASDTSGEIKEGLSMDEYARRRRAQMSAHRVR